MLNDCDLIFSTKILSSVFFKIFISIFTGSVVFMPKKRRSTLKIVKHLKSLLRELELAYNLAPELTPTQINDLKKSLLIIFGQDNIKTPND